MLGVSRDVGDEHSHFLACNRAMNGRPSASPPAGTIRGLTMCTIRLPKSTSASPAASTFFTQSVLPCPSATARTLPFRNGRDDGLVGLTGLAAAMPDLRHSGHEPRDPLDQRVHVLDLQALERGRIDHRHARRVVGVILRGHVLDITHEARTRRRGWPTIDGDSRAKFAGGVTRAATISRMSESAGSIVPEFQIRFVTTSTVAV